MKIDFEEVFRKLDGKANAIYVDRDRLKKLLVSARKKAENNKQLSELWEDIKILLELLRDWMKGDYKDVTKSSVLMVIVSLLYLVNPIDLIPDFFIGGFIDDLAVLGYIIKKISDELDKYKNWKAVKCEDTIFEAEKEDVKYTVDIDKSEDDETFSI